MKIVTTVPVKIESSLNLREGWRVRANRNTSHRAAAYFAMKQTGRHKIAGNAVITLTRIAPRELDSDNLAGGFKSVRDGVADWLGIDDGDKRLLWLYAQRKGKPHEYAAEVEIRADETFGDMVR